MGLVTGDITHQGAVVGVLVGVSRNWETALRRVGHAVPHPVPVRALIDTGSNVTGLMRSILASLEIKPFSTIRISTPSTPPDCPHPCDLYDSSLSLVEGIKPATIPSVHVIAPEDFHHEEGVQALIGRDVLNLCNFQYLGPEKKFMLAF